MCTTFTHSLSLSIYICLVSLAQLVYLDFIWLILMLLLQMTCRYIQAASMTRALTHSLSTNVLYGCWCSLCFSFAVGARVHLWRHTIAMRWAEFWLFVSVRRLVCSMIENECAHHSQVNGHYVVLSRCYLPHVCSEQYVFIYVLLEIAICAVCMESTHCIFYVWISWAGLNLRIKMLIVRAD